MRGVHVFMAAIAFLGYLLQPASVAHAQTVATAGFYNNDSLAVQYISGTWTYQSGATYSRAMNSDLHVASTNGATVTFAFQGSRVTYWYSMAFNRGGYNVYIDNVFIEQVLPSSGFTMRQIGRTWTVTNPAIAHTLKIVFVALPSGVYLDVDAFSVDVQTYTLENAGDGNDPSIRKIGSWDQGFGDGGAYNNTLAWSNVTGDLIRYTYTGDQVTYVYSKGPNYGIASVFVDGYFRTTIDMWSGSTAYIRNNKLTLTSPDTLILWGNEALPTPYNRGGQRVDTHTVEILVTGTKNTNSSGYFIDVDRIYTESDTLGTLDNVSQTAVNWCWATVAQIVGQYMTSTQMVLPSGTNSNRQCDLVKTVYAGTCPDAQGPISWISAILSNQYGSSSTWNYPSTSLAENTLRAELLLGIPVIERWQWNLTSGHFIVIRGFDAVANTYLVTIPDSNMGVSINTQMTYSQLGSGTYNTANYTWNGYTYNIRR